MDLGRVSTSSSGTFITSPLTCSKHPGRQVLPRRCGLCQQSTFRADLSETNVWSRPSEYVVSTMSSLHDEGRTSDNVLGASYSDGTVGSNDLGKLKSRVCNVSNSPLH